LSALLTRVEETTPVLGAQTADDLLGEIRAALKRGYDAGILSCPLHDLFRYVTPAKPPPEVARATGRMARGIVGGVKDFKREPESRQLVRKDGAWFHFTLTVGESRRNEPLELVAYNFELVYPVGHPPPFVRFDLNQHGHANQAHDFRSHVHPGSRDLLVPAPILAPLEAIDLMLTLPIVAE
jgi:hypothetical protein